MVDLFGRGLHFPAKLPAPALRCLHSGAGALGDKGSFEFSKHSDIYHMARPV
jgi:hypothetical protein